MRWWSPYFREDGGVWEGTPGEASDVQVVVESIGAARWVDREPASPGGDCPDLVAAGLRVTLFSRYGQLGWLTQRYGTDNDLGIGIASWPDWDDCSARGWTPALDQSALALTSGRGS
jgi:hypothetical protein